MTRRPRLPLVTLAALAALLAIRTAALDAADPVPGRWEPLGPNAGTVFALAQDPGDPRVLLAGTYLGGLYRTSDYGAHWAHVPTPFSSRMVLSIAFDSVSARTVYAGTFQDGVYRSTDGGTTWVRRTTGLSDSNVTTIAVDPLRAGTLLAATSGGGIYRSVDRGDSWSPVLAVAAKALMFDSRTAGVVLAGAAGRVWRSVDGGQTWMEFASPTGTQDVSSLIVDPSTPDGYLAAGADGVYQLDPDSAVWQNRRANLPASPVYQIAVFPGSSVWFAVTDAGIFVNGGTPDTPAWTPWAVFDVEPRRLLFTAGGAAAFVALRHGALKATADLGRTWFDATAGIQNLFVGALATRPAGADSVLFAGSDLGVHLTAPSFGTSLDIPNWFHAPAFDEGVFRLVPHPVQENVLFAGTERAGVWKSTDWGVTWARSSRGLVPRDVLALTQSVVAPGTVYAGTSSGVFRSQDGGHTWRAVAQRDLHPTDVTAVAIDPASPLLGFFGTRDGQVFRTLDGENFFSISTGLPAAAVEELRIAGLTRYARLANGQLYSAVDDAPWSVVNVGADVHAVVPGPAGSREVFVGTLGSGVLRSHDGGPWRASNIGLHVPYVFSIAIDPTSPGTMYAGSYLPYRSWDGGETWEPILGDLPFGPVSSIAVDARTPSTIYAAIQDHGIYRSDNRGGSWSLVRAESAHGPMLVDAASADVLVGERFDGVLRSADHGATWQSSADGMSMFTRALAIDPADPDRMYAGSLHGGLFRSLDGGATWSVLGLDERWIEDVAIDPLDPRRLYVGTTTGIARSVDGGVTWTDVGPPAGAAQGLFVLAIAIDPSAPSTVYAATGGFGVWKSTNAGGNWTNVSAGLTSPLVLALALDASHPQTLYAATAGGGVFVSDDAGAAWQPLGQLPNGFVTSLSIDPVQRRLVYAGTEGGGVFRFLRP